MSYSRWSDSAWYAYPMASGEVACHYSIADCFIWNPGKQSLKEFIGMIKALMHDRQIMPNEVDELENILKDNLIDIMNIFNESKNKEEG